MKQTINVLRHGKRTGIVWIYSTGQIDHAVTQRAVAQALHRVFHVSSSQLEQFTYCGSVPTRRWKPFEKRTKRERVGALMAAFFWLLANRGSAHGAEFARKAAAWAQHVYDMMDEDDWNRCCDLIELSHHERLELLLTPSQETSR